MKRPKKKTAKAKKAGKLEKMRIGERLAEIKRIPPLEQMCINKSDRISPLPAMQDLNGSKSATPRQLALPELWCKIEVPVSVRFMEAMRADDAASLGDGRKRPAMLARIYDMRDGSTKDLALPERLATVFAVLPLDGYVGRAFSILRHRRAERKNAAGYTVAEIVEKPAA